MIPVVLSPLARHDIEAIWDYIAHENLDAADRLIRSFEAAFSRLADFPQIGHRRPDLTPHPLLFWSMHRLLIVYHPTPAAVLIVRILSGYQDLVEALSDAST